MLIFHSWTLQTPSHQGCVWCLERLCFHRTLGCGSDLHSDWSVRLFCSAGRTCRGAATYSDWHLFHPPSAAASCWAWAVPGTRRECIFDIHSSTWLVMLFISLIPGKGVYRCHQSTPAAGLEVRLSDCGQIWAAEREDNPYSSNKTKEYLFCDLRGSVHFLTAGVNLSSTRSLSPCSKNSLVTSSATLDINIMQLLFNHVIVSFITSAKFERFH